MKKKWIIVVALFLVLSSCGRKASPKPLTTIPNLQHVGLIFYCLPYEVRTNDHRLGL